MNVIMVKIRKDNGKSAYWPETLNRECAEALVELLRERGQKAKIVTFKVPVKALTSLRVEQP